ncbi:Endosulfine-domain-containing protein [Ganoderma leucocontextum]|nr:Endosulfine-domain-containing protein [Ganoderma leucocontextum]
MLPAKRNKVDISKLTEEEQKLFRLYGKLPTHKNVLTKMQKDRKFFDSGDYALSKAGKAPQNTVGTAIPNPENIPHATSPPVHQSLSVSPTNSMMNAAPAKESPLAEQPMPEAEGAEPTETEFELTTVETKPEPTTTDTETA